MPKPSPRAPTRMTSSHRANRRDSPMFKIASSAASKIGTFALIGYIAWAGWENLGPAKPQIGPVREDLANRVIPDMVEDIRNERGAIREVTLLHFGNDPTDYFTNTLRSTIEQRGTLDLHDRSVSEKVRDLLDLRHPSYASTDAAVAHGGDRQADGVLFGTIHAFESYPEGAKINVEVNLADVSTGSIVFSKRYNLETSSASQILANIKEQSRGFPWFQRLLGWLLAVLLLPVFTISFMRAMLRKESNKTNAFVLAIYTLADALLAWLLVGAALNSWWSALVFVVAVAIAFVYNVRIMTFALRLEGE